MAGLSLLHSIAASTKRRGLWLIIFYCLLTLFFKYLLMLMIVVAIIDVRFNLRKQFAAQI